jgi:hypothetical protein
MKQQQQELAIETEIQGYKKDIVKEQVCSRQGRHTGTSSREKVQQAGATHRHKQQIQHVLQAGSSGGGCGCMSAMLPCDEDGICKRKLAAVYSTP